MVGQVFFVFNFYALTRHLLISIPAYLLKADVGGFSTGSAGLVSKGGRLRQQGSLC